MLEAVAKGPVSVAIEADKSVFQLYKSGVLTQTCGSQLDHGVLVVGYGTLDGQDYWKVKNSWGASWGQDGFILLARGKDSSTGGVRGFQGAVQQALRVGGRGEAWLRELQGEPCVRRGVQRGVRRLHAELEAAVGRHCLVVLGHSRVVRR